MELILIIAAAIVLAWALITHFWLVMGLALVCLCGSGLVLAFRDAARYWAEKSRRADAKAVDEAEAWEMHAQGGQTMAEARTVAER